jgi:hypothetical protein
MTSYLIKIESYHRIELEDQYLEEARLLITNNYEPAIIPNNYGEAEYLEGSITYTPEGN